MQYKINNIQLIISDDMNPFTNRLTQEFYLIENDNTVMEFTTDSIYGMNELRVFLTTLINENKELWAEKSKYEKQRQEERNFQIDKIEKENIPTQAPPPPDPDIIIKSY